MIVFLLINRNRNVTACNGQGCAQRNDFCSHSAGQSVSKLTNGQFIDLTNFNRTTKAHTTMHYLTVSEPQGGRKSVPNSARECEGPELEMNTEFSQKQGKHKTWARVRLCDDHKALGW